MAEILETVALYNCHVWLTAFKNFAIFVDLVNLDAFFNEFVVLHIKIINANGIQEGTHRQATSGLTQFSISGV